MAPILPHILSSGDDNAEEMALVVAPPSLSATSSPSYQQSLIISYGLTGYLTGRLTANHRRQRVFTVDRRNRYGFLSELTSLRLEKEKQAGSISSAASAILLDSILSVLPKLSLGDGDLSHQLSTYSQLLMPSLEAVQIYSNPVSVAYRQTLLVGVLIDAYIFMTRSVASKPRLVILPPSLAFSPYPVEKAEAAFNRLQSSGVMPISEDPLLLLVRPIASANRFTSSPRPQSLLPIHQSMLLGHVTALMEQHCSRQAINFQMVNTPTDPEILVKWIGHPLKDWASVLFRLISSQPDDFPLRLVPRQSHRPGSSPVVHLPFLMPLQTEEVILGSFQRPEWTEKEKRTAQFLLARCFFTALHRLFVSSYDFLACEVAHL